MAMTNSRDNNKLVTFLAIGLAGLILAMGHFLNQ